MAQDTMTMETPRRTDATRVRDVEVVELREEVHPVPMDDTHYDLVRRAEVALAARGTQEADLLVASLAPVFWKAFRRSVAGALRRVVTALNHFMLLTVSLKGLRWRLEARRKDISFAEVIRQHGLVCQVQEVLLIHKKTGLLLSQMLQEAPATKDSDMVSSMLTVVQDFVEDSLSVGDKDRLQTIQVGDLTVWIEDGPEAVLAGILQGYPTDELRAIFRNAIARIHARFGALLAAFAGGDTTPFEQTEPILTGCLRARIRNPRETILPCTWMVLLAIGAAVGVALWTGIRQYVLWHNYIASLEAEPGIVILGHRFVPFGTSRVEGLHDPMATEPDVFHEAYGIPPGKIVRRWQPYQALIPDFVKARARRSLSPPKGVFFELEGDTLTLRGTASREWIQTAPLVARGIVGVSRLDTSGLIEEGIETEARWHEFLDAVRDEPGLVIVESGKREGKYYLVGMRDSLAADPVELLEESGIRSADVAMAWQPYHALNPEFTLARARAVLTPPNGVSLSMSNSVLVMRGEAPHDWIERAHVLARTVAGVAAVDTHGLADRELLNLNRIKAKIENQVFRFLAGAPDLWPGQQQRVAQLLRDLGTFRDRAIKLRVLYSTEIRGLTAATGNEREDKARSATLAARFREVLRMQGANPSEFVVRGMGAAYPKSAPYSDNDRTRDRCVSIAIVIRE